MSDDFYIGYRKEAPPTLARFVRIASVVVIPLVVVIAGTIGASQQMADRGTYGLGGSGPLLVGLAHDPILLGVPDDDNSRAVLLVGRGKHGPPSHVQDRSNSYAGFHGTIVERDGVRMFEMGTEVEFLLIRPPSSKVEIKMIGDVTVEGELIDTKCFLGAMNPAHGKVHRGCAALCLRGGVPPGLAIHEPDGSTRVVVLNANASDSPPIDPELAGRVLRVSGTLEYVSGLPILQIGRASCRERV